MRFVLESVSEQGVRVGKIFWGACGNIPTHPAIGTTVGEAFTPLCLLYTRGGSIPHLTPDIVGGLLAKLDVASNEGRSARKMAMLTLPTLYEIPGREVLTQYKKGIHNFLNLQDHFLYISVQDPHAPPTEGYNEDKNVSIWTKGGRNKVTVTDHLNLVEAFRPNIFESLCDSVSSSNHKLKRLKKSVHRTLRFLDETIALRGASKVLQECSLLGAIVGGDIWEERKQSATETAIRPVDGFVLEGFDLEHSSESLGTLLCSTNKLLPEDKPRFIHGLRSPGEIFTALESGVDVFESSYPFSVSEAGRAIVFTNTLHNDDLYLGSVKGEETGGAIVNDSDGSNCVEQEVEINLNEEKYATDFRPIVPDCVCYACSNHTRAYVHHLLITKEILARVLLMTHNLKHYLTFFDNLRASLQASTYSRFKERCLGRGQQLTPCQPKT